MVEKNKKEFDKILSMLSKIDQEELKKIRASADFLINNSQVETLVEIGLEEFYLSVGIVFKDRGLNCPPFFAFKRLDIYKELSKNFPIVRQFIKKNFPKSKRVQRQQLYRLFIEAVLDSINKDGLVLKLGTFCVRVKNIPALMHHEFPGYIQSGLQGLILEWGDRSTSMEINDD